MKAKQISVHDSHLGMFNTHTGVAVNYNNVTVDMIVLEDICHALSHICRFGGHTNDFYSIAEHSTLVYALAPPKLKKEALTHDFTEAFVGDVIKPLKNLIGEKYQRIEASFAKAICDKFELSPENMEAIKPYDRMALEMEHKAYMLRDLQSSLQIDAIVRECLGGMWYRGQLPGTFQKLAERVLCKSK